MKYAVNVNVSPKTAAKLLMTREIDLADSVSYEAAQDILHELICMPVDNFLKIVDDSNWGETADVKYIPQFSNLLAIMSVPDYFRTAGSTSADYPQMGFFLRKDITASLAANTKYGENHGKTAAVLGIVNCVDSRFVPSFLTSAFCDLSQQEKELVLGRLLFRIPIVQILLKRAGERSVNGYAPMRMLGKSTQYRRASSVRSVLNFMRTLLEPELLERLNNIYWEEDEIGC